MDMAYMAMITYMVGHIPQPRPSIHASSSWVTAIFYNPPPSLLFSHSVEW